MAKMVEAYGWLCEETDECTCCGVWPHEPGCGLIPLERIDEG